MQCRDGFLDDMFVSREPEIVIRTKVDDLLAVDISSRTLSNHGPKMTI